MFAGRRRRQRCARPIAGAPKLVDVRVTWDGVLALLGCIVLAVVPLPRRAEGLRVGIFGAVMGYMFFDAMREASERDAAAIATAPAPPAPAPDLTSTTRDDRLTGDDLLTGFSILRHLRRTGAVSDAEYEAKKVDILRRV